MVLREQYRVERSYAGLILGKKGKGVQPLKELPGVYNVYLDRKAHGCMLRVSGENKASCDAVYHEVQRRINNYLSNTQTNRYMIDVEDKLLDTGILIPASSSKDCIVQLGEGKKGYNEFIVDRFIRGTPLNLYAEDNCNHTCNNVWKFAELQNQNIAKSFHEALSRRSPTGELHFHVSVGKLMFALPVGSNERYINREALTGTSVKDYLKEKNLTTFFNPNLCAQYIERVNKQLALLDFEYIDKADEEEECRGVTINMDVTEGISEWTNCSVELGRNMSTPVLVDDKGVEKPLTKMTKKRIHLRNLTTLSEKSFDIAASLASYIEEETVLCENERVAYQTCWEHDTDFEDVIPMHGGNISCVKKVLEAYTWYKDISIPPEGDDGDHNAEYVGGINNCRLTVRMKKLCKRSKKFGQRDNCVELSMYFDHDRSQTTGEQIVQEMMQLRNWAGLIMDE